MRNTAAVVEEDLYRPREAGSSALVEGGGCAVKLSLISAGALPTAGDPAVAAATAILRDALSGFSRHHCGAGFAVLHVGEQGVWLLLHVWIGGGIATRRLWRADLARPAEFAPAPDDVMACVWELGVIDFERRAWMDTVMAGKPVADYLARRLPKGTI